LDGLITLMNDIDGYEVDYVAFDEWQAAINKEIDKKIRAEIRAHKRKQILEKAGVYQVDAIEYEVVDIDTLDEIPPPFGPASK